jgi:hypothetical protein
MANRSRVLSHLLAVLIRQSAAVGLVVWVVAVVVEAVAWVVAAVGLAVLVEA